MLFRYSLVFLVLTVAGVPFVTTAQQATTTAEEAAVTYLERNWNRHGLASQADVTELVITDAVRSRRSGATSVYLHQGIDGIPILDGQMTISVDEDGRVVYAVGQLVSDLASRTKTSSVPGIDAATAANTIASEAGFPAPESFQVVTQDMGPTRGTTLTDGGGFTIYPVNAKLAYSVDDTGALRLVWDATVPLHGIDGAWRGLIDAENGRVLRLHDRLLRGTDPVSSSQSYGDRHEPNTATSPRPSLVARKEGQDGACYRVFGWPVEDPFHAAPAWPDDGRELMCDPADPVASPDGWHDDGTTAYTITRGNNVHAFADWNSSESPDPGEEPDGGEALLFDFPIDFELEPVDYADAAVTNLFYWVNLTHDVLLHYGFDEAHGAHQETNYTGDGEGGDPYIYRPQTGGTGSSWVSTLAFPDGESSHTELSTGSYHTPEMDGTLDVPWLLQWYLWPNVLRMVGGPSTVVCTNTIEGRGQTHGYGDWYGLMLTQDESAADFGRDESRNFGRFFHYPNFLHGRRLRPYTTDFTVNDFTYGDTEDMGPSIPGIDYDIGFVWATILWEVTWDLIDEYGFEQDIYSVDALAGNTIMLSLVTEALTLVPCEPGFVDSRDAIVEAVDRVYRNQGDAWRTHLKTLLWEGFARRGLGAFADQGSSESNADNVEDFTVLSEAAPEPVTDLVASPDGDFVTLTWTAPSDDDSDVRNYHIRYAPTPILTEEDWGNATEVSVAELTPQAPGATESFIVTGLDFETEYHFAVRSDDDVNTSGLSNSVQVVTLAAPVATVPVKPIDVSVPVGGTETYDYTISNAGPATLAYALSFEETTPALVNGREAIPRPEASEEEETPDEEKREEPSPSSGAPQLLGEGGPDAFGYRWVDSDESGGPTYEWIDITDGTEVSLDDDDRVVIDLPFDFPYYEHTYDWVVIHSNGALSFENSAVPYINEAIPSEDAPNAILAAHWDDLNPSVGGSVYYKTLDDGRFVVSWVGVPHFDFPSPSGSFTFQVILEPGGAVVYQYQTIDPGNFENEATIGIENANGADGLQVVHNAAYLHDELAVRISTLWVESNLTNGQVAAEGSDVLTLSFDALDREPGQYTADMTVMTNEAGDGMTQTYVVPITLTVGGFGVGDEDGVAFDGTHRLSAITPNPIASRATASLEVAEAQDVRVELFDVRGRKVAMPFEGALAARTAQEIALDAGALAPGVYVLRISGETFADSRRFTVVR